ncbi:hypothetical protein OROHE_025005 [Orobanche hederae]
MDVDVLVDIQLEVLKISLKTMTLRNTLAILMRASPTWKEYIIRKNRADETVYPERRLIYNQINYWLGAMKMGRRAARAFLHLFESNADTIAQLLEANHVAVEHKIKLFVAAVGIPEVMEWIVTEVLNFTARNFTSDGMKIKF